MTLTLCIALCILELQRRDVILHSRHANGTRLPRHIVWDKKYVSKSPQPITVRPKSICHQHLSVCLFLFNSTSALSYGRICSWICANELTFFRNPLYHFFYIPLLLWLFCITQSQMSPISFIINAFYYVLLNIFANFCQEMWVNDIVYICFWTYY